MADLFFYGTLCHVPLLETVLGENGLGARVAPARLPGYHVSWVKDAPYPMIAPRSGALAEGLVLHGVTQEEQDSLSYYEGAFGYELRPVEVVTDHGLRSALVFFPESGSLAAGPDWSLSDWVARWGEMAVSAARDVMARRETMSAGRAAALRPFFMARAWSRMLARDGAPATLRRTPQTADDLRLLSRGPDCLGFFELARFVVDHRRFDGTRSEAVERECFVAFDAALVLPYDPATDRVLLIEQLRFGPICREDPRPWVLEPIAGLVDAGEDPAETVRREAMEEAGVTFEEVRPMTRVYASPGYSTEFFHCYLGLADLSRERVATNGLVSEHEDIRSHVLSFDRAMELIESGEINAGPLVMMLYWLAAHRVSVRGFA